MMDKNTLYGVLDLCLEDLGHQYKGELNQLKSHLEQRGFADMYLGLLRDCRLFAGWCQRYRAGKCFNGVKEKDIKDYLHFCEEELMLDPAVLGLHKIALSYLYSVLGNIQNSQLFSNGIIAII